MPQALFRGPIEGVSPWLMPVAHGLEHAREELREAIAGLQADALWYRPGGAASVGWHLLHIAGSTDRLFTYAHGQPLDDRQRDWLELERGGSTELGLDDMMLTIDQVFDRCLEALRRVDDNDLQKPREVGAAKASCDDARPSLPRRRARATAQRSSGYHGQSAGDAA